MAKEIKNKIKLNILSVFSQSNKYWGSKCKEMIFFTLSNFLLLAMGILFIKSFSNPLFLAWVVFYYIFWSYFFRYVFDKKPYYQSKVLRNSLVPSTKIFFLTIVVFLFIISLPWLLSFIAIPFDLSDQLIVFMDRYIEFLERGKEDVELVLSFISILISPFILYRPFYAWIAAIVGRKGSMSVAFRKTKGNYWQFLMLGIIMNSSIIIAKGISKLIISLVQIDDVESIFFMLLLSLILSPIIVYYNIFMAKSYEVFYPEG